MAVARLGFARSYWFLVLSGLATEFTVCYFRAQLGDAARVAPIGKLSVVLVAVFSVVFLGSAYRSPTGWGRPYRRRRCPRCLQIVGGPDRRRAANRPGYLQKPPFEQPP